LRHGEINSNFSLHIEPLGFIFGYLVGDTVFLALPEFLKDGRYEYLIHHVFAFVLFYGLLTSPVQIARYLPHLFICEVTNIFFIIAWHLRVHGLKSTLPVYICEFFFAVTFFITRILNLPIAMYALLIVHWESTKWVKFALVPIMFLQFYWFAKIISALRARTSSIKRGKVNDSEDKLK
jgi:hypothetical protein